MEEEKMKIERKKISHFSKAVIVLQLFLVVGFFIFIMFFTPKLEYPRNGEIINKDGVEFKFRNANVILIDDNSEFSSAREIDISNSNYSRIIFEPGTYYWKAVGLVESSPREFIVNSRVGLELNKEKSTLQNVGNAILDVGVSGSEGLVILGVDVEYPVNLSEEVNYKGEEHEE